MSVSVNNQVVKTAKCRAASGPAYDASVSTLASPVAGAGRGGAGAVLGLCAVAPVRLGLCAPAQTDGTPKPLPCPVTTSALLGGVRSGRVIALCSGSSSDVGLGENDKQVWVAKRLGGTFGPSGPVVDSSNELEFAAASAQDMTYATAFPLASTFNAGRTWTYELAQPNGASWNDLSFSSATTGVVVCSTFSNAGKEIGTVYRTTDGGRVWHALSLP